jgi:RimJ/RimL family protein N-acetyltransferase
MGPIRRTVFRATPPSIRATGYRRVMLNYAPLDVRVSTPRIELVGATDDLLGELQHVVRAGRAVSDPAPFDDPMSLYEEDPDVRVRKWLQGVWRGRGSVTADFWRLHFVVLVQGRPVGMQDLIGDQFGTYGSVVSFSWLDSDLRRQGYGTEMRHAILHLAFEGLGASEAATEAFQDNPGSNGVSRSVGYRENGVLWATRRGEPGLMQRWRITRQGWEGHRRSDIELRGSAECKEVLGLK